jgi:hypothetical protein
MEATPIRKEVDDVVSTLFKDLILFSAFMNQALIFFNKCRLLDTGCWMMGAGCRVRDFGCRIWPYKSPEGGI